MKVLIVRLSAIGDVIQGIPCLVALKESFPDWRLSWLVEETSAPVLEGHPCLDKLFVLGRDWRKKGSGVTPPDVARGASNFRSVWRALREERFDVAIDLQGLFKSGLWTWLSGAPRRVGHDRTRELAHWFLNEYAGNRPTFDPSFPLVERYLEPARHLGADVSKGHYLLPPASAETRTAADRLLEGGKKWIALCPWSAWGSKNWPLERWREAALDLAKDFHLVLIGSAADQGAAKSGFAGVPNLTDLTGRTSLPVLAEIFRRCRVAVGPDSGPLHLANAADVPRVVMLFGSTSWRRSGPRGEKHRALALDLECQPCFERVCPLGHFRCLQSLETARVIAAVREAAGHSVP